MTVRGTGPRRGATGPGLPKDHPSESGEAKADPLELRLEIGSPAASSPKEQTEGIKPSSERQRVAVIASLGDTVATRDGIPGRLGPFDTRPGGHQSDPTLRA